MTDQRIEGAAAEFEGKAKNGLGRILGDGKLQAEGRFDEVKGKAINAYGRVIDGLGKNLHRVPTQYQDRARQGLDFARNKPLLTTGIVAGAALILGSLLGRRR